MLTPTGQVGHAVSPDLLRFHRVADVLSAPSQDEQCYDGSSSIITVAGKVPPIPHVSRPVVPEYPLNLLLSPARYLQSHPIASPNSLFCSEWRHIWI